MNLPYLMAANQEATHTPDWSDHYHTGAPELDSGGI